jgi:hypothetical protein
MKSNSITCFSSFKETGVFAWQGHNLTKEGVVVQEKETHKFTYNGTFA